MPSTPQTRNVIAQTIRDNHGDCDNLIIYDLGSGWGGLCRKLARKIPSASITGFEISPVPFLISKLFQWIGLNKYRIHRADIFKLDLTSADIIVCYLSHYHMRELAKKMNAECKKGTTLYSQGFPIETMTPEKTIDIPFSLEKKLYQYKF